MSQESKAGVISKGCAHTRRALLAMNLTGEPLTALYTLLPVILYQHLHATPLELSLFITLRPLLSVFSFYWSSHLLYYQNRLLPNLMGAWLLSRLPFIFVFFFPNFWFLFFAAAIYQLFNKAGIPAWIEILKRNIPKEPREHLFSLYTILAFLEGAGLSFIIGKILDISPSNWSFLFCIAASLGLCSLFFLRRIKTTNEDAPMFKPSVNRILHPWKTSLQLLRAQKDFARFQIGFMAGGGALMIMAPALSIFYVDKLALSYTTLSLARFAFMGLGVILSSLIWKKGLKKFPINFLAFLVLIGFCFFPISILLAQVNGLFVYLAFFIYGIAQAGSQLIWNLSGTIFAEEGDSLPYTNVNILMLGIRGAAAPLLGGQLCQLFGPGPVLLVGIAILLIGIFYMSRSR